MDPCVALTFKVTVVPDFYRDVFGFALSELVLTFELPLADVAIAFGSGEVSTILLPLRFYTPVNMLFFPI